MGSAVARQLVFRLNEMGFVLDLASVVEIREQIADDLDLSRNDLRLGIVGALSFRRTRIPVVDPTIRLDVASSVPLKEKTALVLNGPEGNWGLLVDSVGEISPADKFLSCEIPSFLKGVLISYYTQVVLLDREPFVVFKPDYYYGASG